MIYFIQADGVGHVKIGFTANDDAAVRLATLQVGSPVPLKLLGTIPGTLGDEKNLHRRFASARVHGEWFRPIPELLALISPVEPLECGGTTVTEQSVSIRVLTVGRKQFSKQLLDQLPVRWCIDWVRVAGVLAEDVPPGEDPAAFASGVDLRECYYGNVWGWVKADQRDNPFPASIWSGKFRWVLYECDSFLYKSPDYEQMPKLWAAPRGGDEAMRDLAYALLGHIYDFRHALPGWSWTLDQLFIGV